MDLILVDLVVCLEECEADGPSGQKTKVTSGTQVMALITGLHLPLPPQALFGVENLTMTLIT
jgi:hypothetical protein